MRARTRYTLLAFVSLVVLLGVLLAGNYSGGLQTPPGPTPTPTSQATPIYPGSEGGDRFPADIVFDYPTPATPETSSVENRASLQFVAVRPNVNDCFGEQCNGAGPVRTSCARGARVETMYQERDERNGKLLGVLKVLRSSKCGTAWAEFEGGSEGLDFTVWIEDDRFRTSTEVNKARKGWTPMLQFEPGMTAGIELSDEGR